ncbi:MAG: cell division protein ZapA [Dechloromonas sp.]|nr:cell division protein ZapA [Dechloromonas sp.]
MSGEQNHLDIKILGREYRVACLPEEMDSLRSAVDLVDGKMREIAQKTRSTIAERVAVMAALNIAHEHLSIATPLQNHAEEMVANDDAKRRIDDMGARLDAVLAPQKQLDL